MPDPTSKPPSLVDVLENAKRFDLVGLYSHSIGPESCGDYLDRDDVLKIAAPYAKRLAGLERAFAEAKVAQGRHGLVTAWRLLEDALAAVPEIKENTNDG